MSRRSVIKWTLVGSISFVLLTWIAYRHLDLIVWALATQQTPKTIFVPIPFNAEQWKTADISSLDRIRYRMHQDLLRRYSLIGMTHEELIALLGPPSNSEYFKEWDIRYPMGPEPGVGIDFIWLVFKLQNNRVAEYQIVTD